MIKTTGILVQELEHYANPVAKIRRMVKAGELIPLVRGIYETNRGVPGHLLAPVIYGPSYLSFEFALSYHGLIPEAVRVFTSASYNKKKIKRYENSFGTYTYRDIPGRVYPIGILHRIENGYAYFIASPEKALCDQLYPVAPLDSQLDLERYLFEDLRITREDFWGLNTTDLIGIADRYRTRNHRLLAAYIRRRMKNGSDN